MASDYTFKEQIQPRDSIFNGNYIWSKSEFLDSSFIIGHDAFEYTVSNIGVTIINFRVYIGFKPRTYYCFDYRNQVDFFPFKSNNF